MFTCAHEISVKILVIYSNKLVLLGAVDSSPPVQLARKVTSTLWAPLPSTVRSRGQTRCSLKVPSAALGSTLYYNNDTVPLPSDSGPKFSHSINIYIS